VGRVTSVRWPAARWRTSADRHKVTGAIPSQVSRALTLAMLATLLIAGCSFAVAAVGGLLERRIPFALLRLTGTPSQTLRAVVMREAALPLFTLATISALLGLGVS
jgi:predicted lysophospholipase L1 biosynthesis ABC-type transport system permease subunit